MTRQSQVKKILNIPNSTQQKKNTIKNIPPKQTKGYTTTDKETADEEVPKPEEAPKPEEEATKPEEEAPKPEEEATQIAKKQQETTTEEAKRRNKVGVLKVGYFCVCS